MFIQGITIAEYYRDCIKAQVNFKSNQIDLARQYVTRVHGETPGLKFVHFISSLKPKLGKSAREIISDFAKKQLIHLVTNSLIEYVAEVGINVLDARYQDMVDEETGEYGPKTHLDCVKEALEIQIEDKTTRPLSYVHTWDFIPPGYHVPSTEPDVDFDKLSDEEWKNSPFTGISSGTRIPVEEQEQEEQYKQSVLDEYQYQIAETYNPQFKRMGGHRHWSYLNDFTD